MSILSVFYSNSRECSRVRQAPACGRQAMQQQLLLMCRLTSMTAIDTGAVLRKFRGPFKSMAACSPTSPQNAVSYGCIVQCLCSSLVFVLHFLILIWNFTLF